MQLMNMRAATPCVLRARILSRMMANWYNNSIKAKYEIGYTTLDTNPKKKSKQSVQNQKPKLRLKIRYIQNSINNSPMYIAIIVKIFSQNVFETIDDSMEPEIKNNERKNVESAKKPLIFSLGKNKNNVKNKMEISDVAPKLISKYFCPTFIRASLLFRETFGLFKTDKVVSRRPIPREPLYIGKSQLPVV